MQQSHASPDVKHANVCMKFGTHRSQLDSPAMHEHTNPQRHDQKQGKIKSKWEGDADSYSVYCVRT